MTIDDRITIIEMRNRSNENGMMWRLYRFEATVLIAELKRLRTFEQNVLASLKHVNDAQEKREAEATVKL